MSDSREWNASTYHRISGPQVSWGKKVLARLHLRGDESVLDAGCGTGRLTEDLLQALPGGRVVGVDRSQNMLRSARQHLGRFSNLTLVAADLQHLPFYKSFDVIFSTAAFHWIKNQQQLYQSLHGGLRPGAWLIAQCGGGPNLARLRQRIAELINEKPMLDFLAHFEEPWVFETAESAAKLMRDAGFMHIETSIEPAPTVLSGADEYREFVSNVILHPYLGRLPNAELKSHFVDLLTRLAGQDTPCYSLDYWRLNLRGCA